MIPHRGGGTPENPTLRIGIDGRLLGYRRGMGNVVHSLLTHLAAQRAGGGDVFIVYVSDPGTASAAPRSSHVVPRHIGPAFYPLWEQVVLPGAASRDGVDVLHCPANTAPVRLSERIKLVVSIHDVIYLLPGRAIPPSPSPRQRAGALYRRLVVPPAARRADAIVTVSEQSRRDIAETLRLPSGKIHVMRSAPSDRFLQPPERSHVERLRAVYGLSGAFMLALGATDPRKNTDRIIRAYARYRAWGGTHHLVFVGLAPGDQQRFSALAGNLGVLGGVRFLPFVSEADLVACYHAAEMLVYPSLYEGFGLPVLEAMACGTPVIASDRGALPEIARDAAWVVDPLQVDAIAAAMVRMAQDADLRAELIRRGRARVSEFSWTKTARETYELYRSLARGGGGRGT